MSLSKTYVVWQLHGIEPKQYDILIERLFALEALGVAENLQFEQPEDDYQAHTVNGTDPISIKVYFTAEPPLEDRQNFQRMYPNVALMSEVAPYRDWNAEWKKSFRSFQIIEGLWIVPSWEAPQLRGQDKAILLDPGMAFGTGTHATTALVARLLKSLKVPDNVLDVGTGTGILAMIALRLGTRRVTVTEVDPDAERVANENFEKNHLREYVHWSSVNLNNWSGQFPVVIANIIDGVLIKLSQNLIDKTEIGGHILLSGILAERWETFSSQWDFRRTRIVKKLQQDEWVGLCLERTL